MTAVASAVERGAMERPASTQCGGTPQRGNRYCYRFICASCGAERFGARASIITCSPKCRKRWERKKKTEAALAAIAAPRAPTVKKRPKKKPQKKTKTKRPKRVKNP